ncbi:hypothetical protein ALC56_05500 [Trachymyrmex septentrionalis]|uniref:Protein takeout n=2 Tax=Trachymyrmex septentrionalis TaxID=34720 RepID=A0A151JXU9_9HYME|nr:hypothetical protein ALC56_05500 [Trachymyrmex septentrionalis]
MCTKNYDVNVLNNQSVLMDKIVIFDTNNLKLYLKDIKILGVCDNANIKYIHVDPDRLHYNIELVLRKMRMNASYNFDIRVLVPLANKGLVTIKPTNDAIIKVNLDLKVATKNEKKEIYVSKVKTNINITGIEYTFDESEKDLVQLHQAIKSVVDSNTTDIINIVMAALEEKLSQLIIYIFNTISRSNYEELFEKNV